MYCTYVLYVLGGVLCVRMYCMYVCMYVLGGVLYVHTYVCPQMCTVCVYCMLYICPWRCLVYCYCHCWCSKISLLAPPLLSGLDCEVVLLVLEKACMVCFVICQWSEKATSGRIGIVTQQFLFSSFLSTM